MIKQIFSVFLVLILALIVYSAYTSFSKPGGSSCRFDWECTSGTCKGLFPFRVFFGGKCADKGKCGSDSDCPQGSYCDKDSGQCEKANLQVGDACSSSRACVTQACARVGATDSSPTTCCPPGPGSTLGSRKRIGFYYFCQNMPAGSVCKSNVMCVSGTSCVNGKCVKNGSLPYLSPCSGNASCKSRVCADVRGGDGKVCCPLGSGVHYPFSGGSTAHCTNLPAGAACWTHKACASHRCSKGKCT